MSETAADDIAYKAVEAAFVVFEAVEGLAAEVRRLRAAEANYVTFGQGGAGYAESQWLARNRRWEECHERTMKSVEDVRAALRKLHDDLDAAAAAKIPAGPAAILKWRDEVREILARLI